MSSSPARAPGNGSTDPKSNEQLKPPTIAAFSPTSSYTSPTSKQRGTILVHRKSPLLIATPPSITRALAFSHPFLLPLNKLVGLLSWTSGDPWESFLVVAGFWAVVLYGDAITRWAGPVMVVMGIILGMYSRRYSPLSSTGWTGEKQKTHKRDVPESKMKHQKSLDEIVDTLSTFTTRCNILLEPFLQMTDFLSTQRTATSASTKPALTTLFIRILLITPIWILATLPPFQILTTRRVVLTLGTLILTWHSRPSRVSRTILWRSRAIRRISSTITGLSLMEDGTPCPPLPPRGVTKPPLPPRCKGEEAATKEGFELSGARFTFVVFENQRRWLGLGWTHSLLAYERAAWTDEHLNPSDPIAKFRLPEIDSNTAQWRWVEGSEWQVEGAGRSKAGDGVDGWIYYDNKVNPTRIAKSKSLTKRQWNDGRRGQDGWGRYTRRRKWYRDAELVEISPDHEASSTATLVDHTPGQTFSDARSTDSQSVKDSDDASSGRAKKRGFLRRGSRSSAHDSGFLGSNRSTIEDESDYRQISSHEDRDGDWGVGDDVRMGLG